MTVRTFLKGGFGRAEVGDLEEIIKMETEKLIEGQAPAYLRSTFALRFGRCVARASSWMFKLVHHRKYDGVGAGFPFEAGVVGLSLSRKGS